MKKLSVALLCIPIIVNAQIADFNKIVLPASIADVSFEEKLVQLGWNNHPSSKVAYQSVEMFGREKAQAAWSWLEGFTATFNANQFTLDPESDVLDRSAFYPRYNFSIRFSLGTFVNVPLNTKIADDRMVIGEHRVNELKLTVRRNVLAGVEEFKERYKVLRLRDRMKEDFLVAYKEAEKQFSAGTATIAQYQTASQAYYNRSEGVITAQSEFNQTKITLESLIGVRLEEVPGFNTFLNQLESEMRGN